MPTSRPLIERAQRLYDSLNIADLERQGILRDHTRHYGMVVYPSIRSARPVDAEDVFAGIGGGTARLYLHIPFCTGRCTFCHFQLTSKPRNGQRYLDHLLHEIDLLAAASREVAVHGTFMGGGTPSLLTADELDAVMGKVHSALRPARSGFNTIEIHPEFVRAPEAQARLERMRALGFNRVSIGVQAFEQATLDRINRRHSVEENYRIVETARRAGFEYIDVDLMYGLPGQSLNDWAHSLAEAAALDIDSVSIFYLIWRDDTPMGRQATPASADLPSRRECTVMRIMACEALQEAGFTESLTDHYHREYPSRQLRPRTTTMTYSSFFVLPVGISGWGYANRHHYWNTFDVDEYCDLVARDVLPVTRAVFLDSEEQARRDIMFCLKYGALPFQPFRDSYGIEVADHYRHVIEPLADLGLVEVRGDGVDLSYTGRLFMEEVCSFFFSDAVWRDIGRAPTGVVPAGHGPSRRDPGESRAAQIVETFHYLITPRRAAPEQVLAVVASPDGASFTHALARAFREGAELGGHAVSTVDLYAGGFPFVADAAEVARQQHLVAGAGVLAVFAPIWWYSVPALLRAWYEQVFSLGFAFDFDLQQRYRGLLGDKRLVVVNTAADSAEGFDQAWGASYLQSQVHSVFDTVGISRKCVRVFLNVHHAPADERHQMLAETGFLGRHLDFPVLYESPAPPATDYDPASPYRRRAQGPGHSVIRPVAAGGAGSAGAAIDSAVNP